MRVNDECEFEPGDLLLFAGRGLESRWIAAVTCSPAQLLAGQWFSHVGICARDPHGRVLLWESTTLCDLPCEITGRKIHGVQAHLPCDRLAHYDGAAWRLRLARARHAERRRKLATFGLRARRDRPAVRL